MRLTPETSHPPGVYSKLLIICECEIKGTDNIPTTHAKPLHVGITVPGNNTAKAVFLWLLKTSSKEGMQCGVVTRTGRLELSSVSWVSFHCYWIYDLSAQISDWISNCVLGKNIPLDRIWVRVQPMCVLVHARTLAHASLVLAWQQSPDSVLLLSPAVDTGRPSHSAALSLPGLPLVNSTSSGKWRFSTLCGTGWGTWYTCFLNSSLRPLPHSTWKYVLLSPRTQLRVFMEYGNA